MKVSLDWAQSVSNVPLNEIGTAALLKKLGAQLGAIEEVINFGERYDKAVVAKVVVCEKHPDADRLNVCKINDGGVVQDVERDENGLVQVVCGAPNAREGLTVAWLPPGSTVPSSLDEAEPFVLGSRELRGVMSNGMLASPKELGISNDHQGILEIKAADVGDNLVKPGTPLKRLFGLDDVVIDCENKMFTHRPDCFGILGVARELAGIQQQPFKSPDWYIDEPQFESVLDYPLEASIADEHGCSRIMFVAMKNVQVGQSPLWMQSRLSKVGLKPINNIVDITNYYMHLTGQPTHAYDYDKVLACSSDTPSMTVRPSVKGETIALLNGKTIELSAGTTVISTDKTVVGIAGVMGGADTEVDENTKNIIIEVGTFDMYQIRRTSMHYGLFTDAVTRFTKGQSPLQNDRVLRKIMDEVQQLAGGQQASQVCNEQSSLVAMMPAIRVTADFVNTRLGSRLTAKEMAELLQNVELDTSIKNDELIVQPSFWRKDLELPEDIVEEIGRLYGFDQLPVALPRRQAKAPLKNAMLSWKAELRSVLARLGANELLTYSFVHSDLLARAGLNTEHVFHIRNAISPELQYYRLTLMPSLLDKVRANIRSERASTEGNAFALFEINKVHIRGVQDPDEPNVPAEHEHLALVFAADDKTANREYGSESYYQAVLYLREMCALAGVSYELEAVDTAQSTNPVLAPFDVNRTAAIVINGEVVGFVGEFNAAVEKSFKLPAYTAGFELNISALSKGKIPRTYKVMPTFPKTEQDITLEVAPNVPYAAVRNAITLFLESKSHTEAYFWHCEPLDIYSSDSGTQRLTFRIWFARFDRTMQTAEVNSLLDELVQAVNQTVQATRI